MSTRQRSARVGVSAKEAWSSWSKGGFKFLSIFLVGAALFVGPSISIAKADDSSNRDITITSNSGAFSSTLRLSLSKPMTAAHRQRVVQELSAGMANNQVIARALMKIDCYQAYVATASEGRWKRSTGASRPMPHCPGVSRSLARCRAS